MGGLDEGLSKPSTPGGSRIGSGPLISSQKPPITQAGQGSSKSILEDLPPKLLTQQNKEELEKELSKSPVSSFSDKPPASKTPSAPSGLPMKPTISPPSVPKQSSPAPAIPYRSSIRTLESDTKELKKGKAPSGTEVELKTSVPPLSKPLPSGPPPPIKGKVQPEEVEIKLGKPEKAKPLELSKMPGGPPVKIPEKPKETVPSFGIPPKKRTFSKITTGIIIIGLIAIGALVFLFFRQDGEPLVTESPALTPTPPPLPKLSEILGTTEEILIDTTQGNSSQQLLDKISLLDLTPSSFKILKMKDEFGADYDFSRFLSSFGINFYPDLVSALDTADWSLFVFGQLEKFDDGGSLIETASASPVLGFSIKVKDKQSARSSLNLWESTVNLDLKDLFNHDPSKATLTQFSDNIYRGSSIRYVNFPYPDKSIDYVILKPFFAGDKDVNYLIFTSSREGMYKIIDTLGGI